MKRYQKITALCLALLLALLTACSPAAKKQTETPVTATETVITTEAAMAATEIPTALSTEDGAKTTKEADESAAKKDATETVTVVDMMDRTVEISLPVERVVAVTPSDCEILFALGAGETLVGRGTYANYPAEVLDVTEVASGGDFNAEQVIALEPDLVLMSAMAQDEEDVSLLEKAGIAVVVNDADTIEEVYESIALIGKSIGKDQEAADLVASMKDRFAAVAEAADQAEDCSIYFEVSPLEYGLWTAGKNTFLDEIATLCGCENAFADVDGWGEVSEEQVIERDPDVIVTITMYFGDGPTPVEEIMSRPAWKKLKAVAAGAVYLADNDEISRPGPRLADAAEALQAFLKSLEDENSAR